MGQSTRNFKTIYFPYIDDHNNRTTKNICVAFNCTTENELFEKIKHLTTTEIKKTIGIFSYNQISKIAKNEDRKITEIIKLRLKDKILGNNNEIRKNILINPYKIQKWCSELKKIKTNNAYVLEIINFLDELKN